jgi:hypothetical protein
VDHGDGEVGELDVLVAGVEPQRVERLCRARTRALSLSWCFLRFLSCSAVLVDQAVDDLPARDPGSHIDRLTGLVQRGSLFARLVRPVIVVVPRVLGQDPSEVPFTVDQQVASRRTSSRISSGTGGRPAAFG